MISRIDVLRGLRRLHWLRERDPVAGEVRGWNWDNPPIRPRAYLGLGVYEVAYRYCPNARDVFLRRVRRIRAEQTQALWLGGMVHRVFHLAARDVRKMLIDGLEAWRAYEVLAGEAEDKVKEIYRAWGRDGDGFSGWLTRLYKYLVLGWCAEAARSEALFGGEAVTWLPWFTEIRVDGSSLGLSSNLRVDALAEGGVVVEVKYGKPADFHRLGLAGYALALESQLEVPVDYGLLVYVNGNGGDSGDKIRISYEYVYIDNSLRHEFLEQRDEIIDMLLSEREPPVNPTCPRSCPFYNHCHK